MAFFLKGIYARRMPQCWVHISVKFWSKNIYEQCIRLVFCSKTYSFRRLQLPTSNRRVKCSFCCSFLACLQVAHQQPAQSATAAFIFRLLLRIRSEYLKQNMCILVYYAPNSLGNSDGCVVGNRRSTKKSKD